MWVFFFSFKRTTSTRLKRRSVLWRVEIFINVCTKAVSLLVIRILYNEIRLSTPSHIILFKNQTVGRNNARVIPMSWCGQWGINFKKETVDFTTWIFYITKSMTVHIKIRSGVECDELTLKCLFFMYDWFCINDFAITYRQKT